MKIRNLVDTDLPAINGLYETYYKDEFGLPSLRNCPIAKVAILNGKLIGFGMANLVPELIMVLDKSNTKKLRVEALKELIQSGISELQDKNFTQITASTPDNNYASILEKHFSFSRMKDIPLVLNLE